MEDFQLVKSGLFNEYCKVVGGLKPLSSPQPLIGYPKGPGVGKSVGLGRVSGRFGAVRGSPLVTDG